MKLFLTDMLCAVLCAAADLVFPYLTNYSLRNLLPKNAYTTFFAVMGALAGAYLLKAFMSFIITYIGHICGVRIEADMRTDLFRHIQKQSFSFFDSNRTGVLMSRITNDLFSITELAHHGPENLLTSLLTLVGALLILVSVRWELALVLFILGAVLLVRRHHRREQNLGREGGKKGDVIGLVALVGAAMLFAFVNYLRMYCQIRKEQKESAEDETPQDVA